MSFKMMTSGSERKYAKLSISINALKMIWCGGFMKFNKNANVDIFASCYNMDTIIYSQLLYYC